MAKRNLETSSTSSSAESSTNGLPAKGKGGRETVIRLDSTKEKEVKKIPKVVTGNRDRSKREQNKLCVWAFYTPSYFP